MDKNAVAATVGLGAIGVLLAFYGFNTYNPDGNPAVTLDTTKTTKDPAETTTKDPAETSTKDPAETSTKDPAETQTEQDKPSVEALDDKAKRQILISKITDLKSRVSSLEEDKSEQPLSDTKSKKVILEVHEDTEAMRENAKQEVTEETDGWSTFWKKEYDKQKDGDKVDEF